MPRGFAMVKVWSAEEIERLLMVKRQTVGTSPLPYPTEEDDTF